MPEEIVVKRFEEQVRRLGGQNPQCTWNKNGGHISFEYDGAIEGVTLIRPAGTYDEMREWVAIVCSGLIIKLQSMTFGARWYETRNK